MNRPHQYPLCLPPCDIDSVIEEKLTNLVCQFNESTDAEERTALHNEITRLRAMLGKGGQP